MQPDTAITNALYDIKRRWDLIQTSLYDKQVKMVKNNKGKKEKNSSNCIFL